MNKKELWVGLCFHPKCDYERRREINKIWL